MPTTSGRSRPWTDHRLAVEGMVWRFRTGATWRDVPERFGKWNSIYKRFDRWATDGTWERLLAEVQAQSDAAGKLDWVTAIDSTITRVHQHGATLSRGPARTTGGKDRTTRTQRSGQGSRSRLTTRSDAPEAA
jgi:transposase